MSAALKRLVFAISDSKKRRRSHLEQGSCMRIGADMEVQSSVPLVGVTLSTWAISSFTRLSPHRLTHIRRF